MSKKQRVTKEKQLSHYSERARERGLTMRHIDDAYGESRYQLVDVDGKVVEGFSTLQDGDWEDYYYDFPLVVVRSVGKRREVKAVPSPHATSYCTFPLPHEYCKQLWIFNRKINRPCELPYSIQLPTTSIGSHCDEPDYIKWYENLPSNIPIQEAEQLEWRIFDEVKLEELKQKYPTKAVVKKKTEVDAEQLELGEENEA